MKEQDTTTRPPFKYDRIIRGLDLNPPVGLVDTPNGPKVITDTDKTHVTAILEGWMVQSASDEQTVYVVNKLGLCICPDSTDKKMICKHAWASVGIECAWLILLLRTSQTLSECDEAIEAMRQHIDAAPAGIRKTVFHEYDSATFGFVERREPAA